MRQYAPKTWAHGSSSETDHPLIVSWNPGRSADSVPLMLSGGQSLNAHALVAGIFHDGRMLNCHEWSKLERRTQSVTAIEGKKP